MKYFIIGTIIFFIVIAMWVIIYFVGPILILGQ